VGKVQGAVDSGLVEVVVFGLRAAVAGRLIPEPLVREGPGQEAGQQVLAVEDREIRAVETEHSTKRARPSVADLQEERPVVIGQRHAVPCLERHDIVLDERRVEQVAVSSRAEPGEPGSVLRR
jgi:hypothetical protein